MIKSQSPDASRRVGNGKSSKSLNVAGPQYGHEDLTDYALCVNCVRRRVVLGATAGVERRSAKTEEMVTKQLGTDQVA